MKLGLFYQSGYRITACFHALKQFRKFYPEASIALYEDNTDILKPISKKFNCSYSKTSVQGRNDPNSGRPAFDLKSTLAWIDRVYEACITTLKDEEYIMNFEDDVWFLREIKRMPNHDLSGIAGYGWNDELKKYLKYPMNMGTYGCGGSIFNREKYIEAYNKIQNIDWKIIEKLDRRPLEWTDSALTFIFFFAGLTVGQWEDASQYRHSNVPHLGDRSGWPGTMEDLKREQLDVAVIHCWKPYYYPTKEEIREVEDELKNYR